MIRELISKATQDKRRAGYILGSGLLVIIIIWFATSAGSRGEQRALKRAVEIIMSAESFHTNAQLALSLPAKLRNSDRPIVEVDIEVDGDVAYQEETPVLDGTIRLEARGRGMVLFADGDLRLLQDKVAFRLDNLPALLNPRGNLVEKWTHVQIEPLKTNNSEDVSTALKNIVTGLEFVGKDSTESVSGNELLHFRREVTPEQEEIMYQVFRQGVSGNRGLHVLARLVNAFEIRGFDVWVDPKQNTLHKIRLSFARPNDDVTIDPRAILQLSFSDINIEVTVEEPEQELTVKPEVFAKIFGSGEINVGN